MPKWPQSVIGWALIPNTIFLSTVDLIWKIISPQTISAKVLKAKVIVDASVEHKWMDVFGPVKSQQNNNFKKKG